MPRFHFLLALLALMSCVAVRALPLSNDGPSTLEERNDVRVADVIDRAVHVDIKIGKPVPNFVKTQAAKLVAKPKATAAGKKTKKPKIKSPSPNATKTVTSPSNSTGSASSSNSGSRKKNRSKHWWISLIVVGVVAVCVIVGYIFHRRRKLRHVRTERSGSASSGEELTPEKPSVV